MQSFIRKLTSNSYAIPFAIFCVCVWRIFTPQLLANSGLGWDGYRYYSLAVDGLQSQELDSYLVFRIFPSFFIHVIFKAFGIAFTPANVILSFKIMNTALITLSAWMVKNIFEKYRLSSISQLTGFTLIFLNYGVLNFTFYYPVMTDTPAFFLSIALLYFFVKGEQLNILLTGIIGAFTLPTLAPMALALLIFPITKSEFIPLKKTFTLSLGLLCFLYAIAMGWFLLFKQGEKADLSFTLPISNGMLPVTFLSVGIVFFFMPYLLSNKTFFSIAYYQKLFKSYRLLFAAALIVIIVVMRSFIPTNAQSEYFSIYHQVKFPILYAFQRPFISLVSHFNYLGCIVLLMIFFWRKFAAFVSTFGLGVAGVVFFYLFVFAMKPETRALIFFFPWLMILMSLYLGKYKFSPSFYILIFVLNFATSKLWLFFDFSDAPRLSDGTIGFPAQWFYMNLGIWMTESVWLWLCVIAIFSLTLFVFSLYRIQFTQKSILFFKKFKPENT